MSLIAAFALAELGALHSMLTMRRIADSYEETHLRAVPRLSALDELRLAAERVIAAARVALLRRESGAPPGGPGAEVEVEAAVADLVAALALYERVAHRAVPDGEDRIDALRPLVGALGSAAGRYAAAVPERPAARIPLAAATAELARLERRIVAAVAARREIEIARLGADEAAIRNRIDDGRRALWLSLGASLLVMLMLGFLAARSVVLPLRRLTEAAERAMRGDFTPPPDDGARDEIGSLGRAFRTMVAEIDRLGKDAEAARARILDSETRFRDFAGAASDWLWETDAAGRLTFLSGRFTELSGLEAEAMLGRPLTDVMQARARDGEGRGIELGSRRAIRNLHCEYRDGTGAARHCRLSGRPVFDGAGVFKGYRGTATDITDEMAAVRQAEHLARHDALTGLPNRVLFGERLRAALARRADTQEEVAVVFLDLDNFKKINDTLGHAAGDALLIEVTRRLRGLVAPRDTIGRLGGDEFAIVQQGAPQPAAAELLARQAMEALRRPVTVDGQLLHTGGSIGIALSAPGAARDTDLLRNADIAMYSAKRDGRNLFRFHDPAMTAAIERRTEMESELRQAIEADRLEVHYQPLYDAAARRIVGLEALVRWPRKGHGLVQPDEFIGLAEESGLIVAMGERVLRRACEDALSWPGLFVAVNLSPAQFLHENLVATVASILRDTCLPAHLLELEITESVLLGKTDAALFQLDALRELGVRIVMDDFGTGYSSLGCLRRFQFDKIKLDRSFVSAIEHDPGSVEIVKSILQLGHALGMQTTAEGVETEGQIAHLAEQGCDQLQGFFFSRAIHKGELPELLRRSGALPGTASTGRLEGPE